MVRFILKPLPTKPAPAKRAKTAIKVETAETAETAMRAEIVDIVIDLRSPGANNRQMAGRTRR
jgi:dihydropteroate synthase